MAQKPSRLDKLVSEAAGVSRAQARTLILKGQVKIGGEVCRKPEAKFTPAQISELALAGKALSHSEYIYVMLNKPIGVESTTKGATPNVAQLLAGDYPRRELFPAGRLDKASEGFVLMTDDGALAHRILAPKTHLEKRYVVTLDTSLTPEMVAGFEAGVTLADGTKTRPAKAIAMEDENVCTVVLSEGKYHQIKRMFGVFGAGVNALKRVQIGPVILDAALAPGEFRPLAESELALLCAASGHTQG